MNRTRAISVIWIVVIAIAKLADEHKTKRYELTNATSQKGTQEWTKGFMLSPTQESMQDPTQKPTTNAGSREQRREQRKDRRKDRRKDQRKYHRKYHRKNERMDQRQRKDDRKSPGLSLRECSLRCKSDNSSERNIKFLKWKETMLH